MKKISYGAVRGSGAISRPPAKGGIAWLFVSTSGETRSCRNVAELSVSVPLNESSSDSVDEHASSPTG